jgi:hypothetical protein
MTPHLSPGLPRRFQTVTTIFPICSFDSMYRWASKISSNLNVRAMIGFSFPLAICSLTDRSRAGETGRSLKVKSVSEEAVGRPEMATLARQRGRH